jgi:RNA polymerase sigma-70 factor (sigma-E family)
VDGPFEEYATSRLAALHRVAYALVGDVHRADDLVQETLTKLYVHWHRAARMDNLDGYVRTIMVNTFLDSKRRRWNDVRLTAEPPEPRDVATPNVADAVTLRALLGQLPPKQRAVLVLRYLADLSVDEVAATLGCAPGTVKSQAFHGLAALRRLLAADESQDRSYRP